MTLQSPAGPIGFVGLGSIGLPMAMRLVDAGHAVIGCDTRGDAEAAFRARGGAWAATPREVADRCETVLVSLPTPEAVEAVALGPEGLVHGTRLRRYVDLSTTGPDTARSVAARLAAARGICALDAPVSGGVAVAEAGALSLMVSGPPAEVEAVRPLLEAIGKRLFHVGAEPGMGQLLKLLNNLLSTTALAATYEVLAVGVKAGLDPSTMLAVLGTSSGTNHAVETKVPKYVLPGLPMGFTLDLSLKDVSLAVEAGEALELPMEMGRVTRRIWREALVKLGPKADYLQVVQLFEAAAGVRLAGVTALPKREAA